MQRRGAVMAVLCCGLLTLGSLDTVPRAQAQPRSEAHLADVIVVLREGSASVPGIAGDLARRHDGAVGTIYEHALRGFAGRIPAAAIEALRRHPAVASVEPDQLVTTAAQQTPTGLRRVSAPANPTIPIGRSSEEAVDADIAIIDTGIDDAHPELAVVSQVNCLSAGCPAGGTDDNGHGTHVAGTAAARDDGEGVVGVAPGARLWSVKVLNQRGSGMLSQVIRGVDWVTGNAEEIEVANLSLGASTSPSLALAITGAVEAGLVVVVAAGNDGVDAADTAPANHPDVISVSALADYDGEPGGLVQASCPGGRAAGPDDTRATFSNFGTVVDIAAPGVCVRSTARGGGTSLMNGTSMAAPHVAGAAALLTSGGRGPVDRAGVEDLRAEILGAAEPDWDVTAPSPLEEPLLDLTDDQVFAAITQPVSGPTVSLTGPPDGAEITGSTTLSATASDPAAAIARVDFLVDGAIVGSSSAAPHTITWDSATGSDGARRVQARARNTGGVHTLSGAHDILVDNTVPEVTLLAPSTDGFTTEVVQVTAAASDATSGLEEIRIDLDGVTIATGASSPLEVPWDTAAGEDGIRTLTVQARDGAGLVKEESFPIHVDNTAPAVSVTAPADGEVVRGMTALTADASDASGVAAVRFQVDGTTVGTTTDPPYRVEWDSAGVPDGPVTLSATATDVAGIATTSTTVTIGVGNAASAGRRLSGTDRWATAARVSEATFEPGVRRVYVATGLDFPDALAAGGVAAAGRVPLLLTARTSLPAATATELDRLDPQEIVVVGGAGAVSQEVEQALADFGPVRRAHGRDRFATAAALSRDSHPAGAPVVLIASGFGFADALAGGPAAAALGGPLLLVTRDHVPEPTIETIRRLGPGRIVVLGGAGAVSDDVLAQLEGSTSATVERWRGPDRFATSVAVAEATHPSGSDAVLLATGSTYADALAGAPAAAGLDAPILLVGRDALPASVAVELGRLQAKDIIVLGGPSAVSQAVLDRAVAASG